MRESNLPPIFSEYQNQVQFVVQRTNDEYSSTCPTCGDTGHNWNNQRDFPDRCRWFLKGNPCGWCRICNNLFWPGKKEGTRISNSQIQEWRVELEKKQENAIQKSLKHLKILNDQHPWVLWHQQMTEEQATYWSQEGIPKDWQDYWLLGYLAEKAVMYNGQSYRVPAYTIPNQALYAKGHRNGVLNIHYRLVGNDDIGRYRYESGLRQNIFYTRPDWTPGQRPVAIFEGAKKAMVVRARTDNDRLDIISIPSKTPPALLLEEIAETYQHGVYWCLDPDAYENSRQFASKCKHGRAVRLLYKADDWIVKHGITGKQLVNIIKKGEPIT